MFDDKYMFSDEWFCPISVRKVQIVAQWALIETCPKNEKVHTAPKNYHHLDI
jgi:hypothetical protein